MTGVTAPPCFAGSISWERTVASKALSTAGVALMWVFLLPFATAVVGLFSICRCVDWLETRWRKQGGHSDAT